MNICFVSFQQDSAINPFYWLFIGFFIGGTFFIIQLSHYQLSTYLLHFIYFYFNQLSKEKNKKYFYKNLRII